VFINLQTWTKLFNISQSQPERSYDSAIVLSKAKRSKHYAVHQNYGGPIKLSSQLDAKKTSDGSYYLGQALEKHLKKEINSHISNITSLLFPKNITKPSNSHVSFCKLEPLAKVATFF